MGRLAVRLALDANIIIYAIDKTSPFHQAAQEILDTAPESGNEIHVSELMFLEVLAVPALSDKEADKFYEIVRRLADINWPVDTDVLLKAAQLRRRYSIKTPDAVHIATAIVHECDNFVTNDARLVKLPLKELKITALGNAG